VRPEESKTPAPVLAPVRQRWLDRPASATQITHRARLWLYVLAGTVLAFLLLPTLIVIPMSFSASQYLEFPPRKWSLRWYEHYFASVTWRDATVTSLKAAALTWAACGTSSASSASAVRPRFHQPHIPPAEFDIQ
jgi:putative spermidine/putrescine transport system permease protein